MSTKWEPWDPYDPPPITLEDVIRAVPDFIILILVVLAFVAAAAVFGVALEAPPA